MTLLLFLLILVLRFVLHVTPCSTVLPEKLAVSQPVNKFPAFYGTRSFITALTSARHLSLSLASTIQSIPPHPTFWRSTLILYSHLRFSLPEYSPCFKFSHQKPVYISSLPIRATFSAYLIIFDFFHPNNIWWGVQITKFLYYVFFSTLLLPHPY
jgi:hypothetical protein